MADSIIKRLEKLEKVSGGDKEIRVFIQCLDDKNYFEQHSSNGEVIKRYSKAELAEIQRQHPDDIYFHVTYDGKGKAKRDL